MHNVIQRGNISRICIGRYEIRKCEAPEFSNIAIRTVSVLIERKSIYQSARKIFPFFLKFRAMEIFNNPDTTQAQADITGKRARGQVEKVGRCLTAPDLWKPDPPCTWEHKRPLPTSTLLRMWVSFLNVAATANASKISGPGI